MKSPGCVTEMRQWKSASTLGNAVKSASQVTTPAASTEQTFGSNDVYSGDSPVSTDAYSWNPAGSSVGIGASCNVPGTSAPGAMMVTT